MRTFELRSTALLSTSKYENDIAWRCKENLICSSRYNVKYINLFIKSNFTTPFASIDATFPFSKNVFSISKATLFPEKSNIYSVLCSRRALCEHKYLLVVIWLHMQVHYPFCWLKYISCYSLKVHSMPAFVPFVFSGFLLWSSKQKTARFRYFRFGNKFANICYYIFDKFSLAERQTY